MIVTLTSAAYIKHEAHSAGLCAAEKFNDSFDNHDVDFINSSKRQPHQLHT